MSQLVVRDDPVPRYWVFVEPLIWEDQLYGRVTVPVGFRSDFASVPPVIRDLPSLDPEGLSRRPAGLHDWLYAWQGLDKEHSDQLLRAALVSVGVEPLVADTFYDGVHDFGLPYWKAAIDGPGPRDFDTLEHWNEWQATLSPTFTTRLPGVLSIP